MLGFQAQAIPCLAVRYPLIQQDVEKVLVAPLWLWYHALHPYRQACPGRHRHGPVCVRLLDDQVRYGGEASAVLEAGQVLAPAVCAQLPRFSAHDVYHERT